MTSHMTKFQERYSKALKEYMKNDTMDRHEDFEFKETEEKSGNKEVYTFSFPFFLEELKKNRQSDTFLSYVNRDDLYRAWQAEKHNVWFLDYVREWGSFNYLNLTFMVIANRFDMLFKVQPELMSRPLSLAKASMTSLGEMMIESINKRFAIDKVKKKVSKRIRKKLKLIEKIESEYNFHVPLDEFSKDIHEDKMIIESQSVTLPILNNRLIVNDWNNNLILQESHTLTVEEIWEQTTMRHKRANMRDFEKLKWKGCRERLYFESKDKVTTMNDTHFRIQKFYLFVIRNVSHDMCLMWEVVLNYNLTVSNERFMVNGLEM
jgi:hypothetical protein